jgi:predicted Zn-dependent protease
VRPEPRKAKPVDEKTKPVLAALPSNDPNVKQAQATLQKGDIRGAIRLLDGIIERNSKNPAPYPTLGDAYALIGNKNGAIAAYRRYLALSPHGDQAKRVETALKRMGGRTP